MTKRRTVYLLCTDPVLVTRALMVSVSDEEIAADESVKSVTVKVE